MCQRKVHKVRRGNNVSHVKCDHSCFNCQHPDCINDELTITDCKFSKALDRYNSETNFEKDKQRKKVAIRNSHNRVSNCEYAKKYYKDNPDKVIKRVRTWQVENREYWNAYMRSRAKGRDDLWSQEDVEYLFRKWGKVQMATLKRRLKRSQGAITAKAHRLGLTANERKKAERVS